MRSRFLSRLQHPSFLAVAATLTLAAVAPAAPPELAVLWVVDGISSKAPERANLKNLQALMAQGVYYRENYTVQTADPSSQPGPWSDLHTSSIPNPVLLAGTAMLLPNHKQHYVQESFFPTKITAHAVNEISYRALNIGFHFTAQPESMVYRLRYRTSWRCAGDGRLGSLKRRPIGPPPPVSSLRSIVPRSGAK